MARLGNTPMRKKEFTVAKFSNKHGSPATGYGSSMTTETRTHEGGQGFTRDARMDLFLLSVTNMVSENTYYETAAQRDARFEKLVHEVTRDDPEWVARFIPWLRNTAQMRSASIVLAAEYVRAGGTGARQVVNSAVTRADEPMEFLGYWLSKYGRRIPMPVKRGLADAARRVFTETNVLKYDGGNRAVRMADVLELTHPKPHDAVQDALFNAIINRRHDKPLDLSRLDTLRKAYEIDSMPEGDRQDWLRQHGAEGLAEAGYTWERLSGWLPQGWDAEAWEKMIPSMGYMALLRNLRNFDRHNISESARDYVRKKLADPNEVVSSRQFPFRFFSAYKAVDTHNWTATIEKALDHSCQNVPELEGSTLVLADLSGSMFGPLSAKSQIGRQEIGALFAAVLAKRCGNTKLVAFATSSREVPFTPNASVLRIIENMMNVRQGIGGGTNINAAIEQHGQGHDRVVIFTDMQTHDFLRKAPASIKYIHGFNLAGYSTSAFDVTQPGRFEYGGFTDATFRLMPILEAMNGVDWPF